jgi:negative regulator of genetic competence, sporulation and motility
MKHALKIALARKDLELNGEKPGRERDFKQKISVMTTRESRQIDDTIDSKQMHAVFATLKSVVQLARGQQETLLSQQDTLLHQQHILKHLQMDYIPPSNERKKSERQDPNMIDLQVNMKKLQDIVEFDFNESRLTSLSEKKRMHDEKHTVVQFREEKGDFIPFEY